MLKSGLYLAFGNISSAVISLARNILVARLLGVEDFGIASTFAITVSLVEMSTDIGLNRYIVQSDKGTDPHFQATVQTIHAARGCLAACVLFLAAGPISYMFNVPEVMWAYQLMALVPLIRGFAHFDIFRFQREMKFGLFVTTEVCAQIIGTVSAVFFSILLNDYRSMLYAIILQQVVYLTTSHIVAKRRYSMTWDLDIVLEATKFGWPLLLNSFLMFLIFHGDRLVVGSALGMEDLAWFSAAFAITFTPTLVLARILRTYMLPILSRNKSDDALYLCAYKDAVGGALLIGVSVALAYVVVGPKMITFLYGSRYAPAESLVALLGIMQACRVAKAGPAIVAVSKAKTTNPLYANIVRALFVPVAWISALNGASIFVVVLIATIAEIVAFVVSISLMKITLKLPLGVFWIDLALATINVSFAFLLLAFASGNLGNLLNIHAVYVTLALTFLAQVLFTVGKPRLVFWYRVLSS